MKTSSRDKGSNLHTRIWLVNEGMVKILTAWTITAMPAHNERVLMMWMRKMLLIKRQKEEEVIKNLHEVSGKCAFSEYVPVLTLLFTYST